MFVCFAGFVFLHASVHLFKQNCLFFLLFPLVTMSHLLTIFIFNLFVINGNFMPNPLVCIIKKQNFIMLLFLRFWGHKIFSFFPVCFFLLLA